MPFQERYLYPLVIEDLHEKMVFVGGPRQVGKTTLAKMIAAQNFAHSLYLNWDVQKHKKSMLSGAFPDETDLVILDELHKYYRWKNYVKGIFDTQREQLKILVTGSARLDMYRRGGDSLFGRYHHYRLHPFSVGELTGNRLRAKPEEKLVFPHPAGTRQHFESLLRFGGFPEPLFKQNEKALRRWHAAYVERLVRDEIRDLETVRDLSALFILVDLITPRVGSRLSLNSLREDLEVAHKTVSSWVDILELFYYLFRIQPYHERMVRSLRKEPKVYLWDWSRVEDPAARLENIIASHLLKFIHLLHDAEGYRAELFYLRDTQAREVDFLIAVNRKPWFAVEVKQSDQEPSKHLSYFGERLKIPFLYQVVGTADVDFWDARKNIWVMSADRFLSALV